MPELKGCPFCGAHVVETGNGYAAHHRAGCFLSTIGGSTFIPRPVLHQWNTRSLSAPVDVEALKRDVFAEIAGQVTHRPVNLAVDYIISRYTLTLKQQEGA